MGYNITIGQLHIQKEPNDGLDCSCINFGAVAEKHESAPAFGEPTDFTNQRWPSYSAWADALQFVGLYSVFFDNGHLVGGHPGVRLITEDLVNAVKSAKASFEDRHPNVKAEYESGAQENGYYCRLVWLHYWINWAFENCETPVIANS